ncbi:hypothetical protein N9575_02870 [Flavobacteriaceae bacterium]|nr:hypothetical protein [Flavobacteriaceae bacterium]MDB4118465.1 hypothetical protein [Flavobacteriaceae bacterium]
MNSKFKIMLPLFLFALVLACSKDNPEPEPIVPTITGLDFTISTNEENPLQVGVTPTATGASNFKVYFDAVGAPATFEETTGSIVTYTYPDVSATYTIKVVATADGAEEVQLRKEHTVTVVPDVVLIDFESINPPYFSGSELEGYIEVVTSGVGDNSTAVGKIVNDGALYTTARIVNMNHIDLTGGVKTLTLDFYQETARAPKIMLKLEGNITDGGFDIDKVVTAQAEAGWQTIEFDMSTANNSYPNHEEPTVTHSQYRALVVFIAFEQADYAGTYYIDNVTTGGSFGDAQPDTDSDGVIDEVDKCPSTSGTSENDGCPAGPSAGAEAPTLDAADVISYFSNAYTNQEMTTWASQYSANASVEEVIINGDDMLKLSITSENGYALGDVAAVNDVSIHNGLHLDVWSATNQSIVVKVVDYGANGVYGIDDTEQALEIQIEVNAGWNSVSKELTGVNTNFAQFVLTAEQTGVIYLDNIYFFTDTTFASSDVQFTVSVPVSATTVTFQSGLYGWDPNVPATDNGDGTWSYTISPAPTAAVEYVWWLDGVSETSYLIAAAADGLCSSLIDGSNLNTDYFSYANRKWSPGDANQSGTYGSCASPSNNASVQFTVSVPATATTVTFQSGLYGWDPNVPANDNGDGTWSLTITPAPTAAVEYVWWLDGVSETSYLIAAAADGLCSSLIDGSNLNTDYFSYANRKWSPGDANQSGTYGSCSN